MSERLGVELRFTIAMPTPRLRATKHRSSLAEAVQSSENLDIVIAMNGLQSAMDQTRRSLLIVVGVATRMKAVIQPDEDAHRYSRKQNEHYDCCRRVHVDA